MRGDQPAVAASSADAPVVDLVQVPRPQRTPVSAILRRIGFALALVVFVALVVRLGRGGYTDVAGGPLSFLDALYYASVTVTTTGYGDITAVTEGARLATILLITPARIVFLILVVGTTVEVLTDQTKEAFAAHLWRKRVKDHYVICGFGATGEAAVEDLMQRGIAGSTMVVVDQDVEAIDRATAKGLVAVRGDATKTSVLSQAGIRDARAVIVAPNRDDTAVLITLTAREMNAEAHIVAGGRAQENLHLLRQGGANEVIDATATVGRMLGIATHAPGSIDVLDDLLDSGTGLDLAEVDPQLIDGVASVPPASHLVAVMRDGHRVSTDQVGEIRPDDRLVVLRDGSV